MQEQYSLKRTSVSNIEKQETFATATKIGNNRPHHYPSTGPSNTNINPEANCFLQHTRFWQKAHPFFSLLPQVHVLTMDKKSRRKCPQTAGDYVQRDATHFKRTVLCYIEWAAKENLKGKNGRGRDGQEGEPWDTPGRLSVLVQRDGFEALRENWLSDFSVQRDAHPRGLSATALLIGRKIRELWLDAVYADQ